MRPGTETIPSSFFTRSPKHQPSSDSATINFFIFGEGNQHLADESWAMDNLSVGVTTRATVPEPSTLILFAFGALGLMLYMARRRSRTASEVSPHT